MPDIDEADMDYLKRLGAVPDEMDLEGLGLLEELELGLTEVSDSGLYHLRGLTSQRRLYLGDTSIGDHGLSHLGGLTGLEELHLYSTQVGDAGMAPSLGFDPPPVPEPRRHDHR